jgi:hypothetical protein
MVKRAMCGALVVVFQVDFSDMQMCVVQMMSASIAFRPRPQVSSACTP